MSKKNEALKLALEFIEQVDYPPYDARPVITALREALAEQPAQHRAWFTVDELSAWADKKLKENPQWAEQPAQVDPCIDGSCSCCWANLDEQPAQQGPVAHVMFRQDEDGLEPVMFYGPGTAPDPATLKDRFVLKDVWLSPPAQRERVVFPTMLRKMWSGGEVQAWLDENVNKENT